MRAESQGCKAGLRVAKPPSHSKQERVGHVKPDDALTNGETQPCKCGPFPGRCSLSGPASHPPLARLPSPLAPARWLRSRPRGGRHARLSAHVPVGKRKRSRERCLVTHLPAWHQVSFFFFSPPPRDLTFVHSSHDVLQPNPKQFKMLLLKRGKKKKRG